jgi:hypothetical protein
MSMQLAVGVVGGIVGAFFGMPQLGFVIGSLIGGALAPKTHNFGPRLDDQKVTTSTYGTGIPTIYGTNRVNGNVIWSTKKLEIPSTQSAGKGGGSSTTTYRYFVHMAVSLGYGPISGIRKVWKDGNLIYDSATGISLNAALVLASNGTNLFNSATVYLGDESQMPDATMESFDGVGNVPAYRGMAYVMFVAIECVGGRVPQFSFEISNSVASSDSIITAPSFTVPSQFVAASRINTGGSTYFFGVGSSGVRPTSVYSAGMTYGAQTSSFGAGQNWYQTGVSGDCDIDALCMREQPGGIDSGNNDFYGPTGAFIRTLAVGTDCLCTGSPYSNWSKRGDNVLFAGTSGRIKLFSWSSGSQLGYVDVPAQQRVVATDNYAWVFDGANLQVYSMPSLTLLATVVAPMAGRQVMICYGAADKLNILGALSGAADLWTASYSGGSITLNHVDGMVRSSGGIPNPFSYPIAVDGLNVFAWVGVSSGGSSPQTVISLSTLTFAPLLAVPCSVAGIITDQCTKAGLSAGQIDVSAITDTVWGYTVTNPASARDNLRPIMTAFAIDATEENGTVKFFKRSAIASMATVPFTDLAAVEDSSTPGDPMPLTHAQQADLFRSVAISYLNPSFDYQTGTETAIRTLTTSINDQTLDLPIATDANTVQSVAQMVLYDNWNERNQRNAVVTRKYAYLSPGDGVTIEYPQGTFQMWRLVKVTDTGKLLQWELVPADSSIYTQVSIAGGTSAAGNTAQTVAVLAPPTQMQIIDSSILQDADNNAGPYVALAGMAAGYPGGSLFVGNDVASLVARGSVQNECPMGYALSALGAWSDNTLDETNTVTVNMGRFTLNSVTRDAMLNSNALNAAAIGVNGRWEIIQFRNATSLGGGKYLLSGFVRGARGTEWVTGLHAVGDGFVMLQLGGMLRPASSVGDVGIVKTYEAVTAGRNLASATAQTYANTSEGLRPFSPVNLRKSVNSSTNDVTLTWDRRTRLSQNWLMGVVPLGETSERYQVDLYTSSAFTTVAGSLTCGSPTITITSAQQTSFGLTPGSTIYACVYQLSDSIGRGHALQATL